MRYDMDEVLGIKRRGRATTLVLIVLAVLVFLIMAWFDIDTAAKCKEDCNALGYSSSMAELLGDDCKCYNPCKLDDCMPLGDW